MSVVTTSQAWPAAGRPFTVAELDQMPDDGRRYELLEGALVVSPRPTTVHQFVAIRLLRALADACPDDLCVVPEPAVELGPQTEFDPDLVVVRMDQIGGAKFELRDGRYDLTAKACGPFTVGRPLSIVPADLTRGLRH
jgi:Uma2 family endonuclease